jgi:Mn2+/Fe2+ NRAMP family transporter
MLLLVNKKRLMGEYTNSFVFNFIAWLVAIVMISLSLALSFAYFF